MEVQGFVSKKERLEKMHRLWLPGIRYYSTDGCLCGPRHPHLFVTLSPPPAVYTGRNFSINTDINTLISPDLDWRKRDNQFEQAFDRETLILVVVEAPTPELTGSAAKALAEKLSGDKKNFEAVTPLGSGEFFEKNGLL